MTHFNQPIIERKNCVWTKKYRRLLEMCIVQHVEKKSLFNFQPIKQLVSRTKKLQSLLPLFGYSFYGPQTDNYVV